MSKQIVVSGNRILTYGENCFVSMGGTVICPDTDRVFQNATIIECNNIPSDIDSVGYEYHAGNFVPCAPYGKGTRAGNVAVVCNEDCKAIKDSGIPFSQVGEIIETECITYSGYIELKYEFKKLPKIIFISGNDETGVVFTYSGNGFVIKNFALANTTGAPLTYSLTLNISGGKVSIRGSGWSPSGSYKAITIC